MAKQVSVELLVIPHCPNESAAEDLIRTALADVHLTDVQVTKAVIGSDKEAARREFVGSPTILLNHHDPFAQPGAVPGLACRVYNTPDGPRGIPSLTELRRALKEAAASSG
jgi:hypothetical protein